MSREDRMDRRRKAKFKKHQVIVKEEERTDIRVVSGSEQTITFKHAVFAKGSLVGRTHTRRHALKLAHQHVRNTRRG